MDEPHDRDKTKIARQFIETIPHASALGMTITEIGDGMAEIDDAL